MGYFTYEDVQTRLLDEAADYIYSRFSKFRLFYRSDVAQEMNLWILVNEEKIRRWLANEPQQMTRVRRSLTDVGRAYAEKEKARAFGYDEADLFWYSPAVVKATLPLALDPTYTGTGLPDQDQIIDINAKVIRVVKDPAVLNETYTAVLDVRRALSGLSGWVEEALRQQNDTSPLYDDAVSAIVQWLGGYQPQVGRRKVQSNASAQAVTSQQYGGGGRA